MDTLDTSEQKNNTRLWTIWLLIAGAVVIAGTFIAAALWDYLGISHKNIFLLGLAMFFAFAINLTGFIMGLIERQKNSRRAMIGILGNLGLMLLFASILMYALMGV